MTEEMQSGYEETMGEFSHHRMTVDQCFEQCCWQLNLMVLMEVVVSGNLAS
jgi:hypothetical protein